MKTATVPAQITTVEDKIVGGLTPYQLTLMIMPLCIGFLAFAALPPNLHLALYKVGTVVILEAIGLVASIRIKDRMLIHWLAIIARYNLRPRYYVYDKNDTYLRDIPEQARKAKQEDKTVSTESADATARPELDMAQMVRLEDIMADPRARLRFITGKDGKLNVIINEVK